MENEKILKECMELQEKCGVIHLQLGWNKVCITQASPAAISRFIEMGYYLSLIDGKLVFVGQKTASSESDLIGEADAEDVDWAAGLDRIGQVNQ